MYEVKNTGCLEVLKVRFGHYKQPDLEGHYQEAIEHGGAKRYTFGDTSVSRVQLRGHEKRFRRLINCY